ncbi:hypothetical protein V8C86DRAFT_2624054 [Haematococcus lacustris]
MPTLPPQALPLLPQLQLPSFHPHPQLTPPTPELRPIPLHPHLAPLLVHPPLPPPPPPPSAPAPARVKANVDEAAEALRRQRTYLLGVLSSRLEELLALLYKPAHITNAACETALKPLSSSGVEKMSPEQVAAHVKAHTEDLDTWVPHITRESLAQSRVEDRVAKRQRKEDKQAAAVAFFGIASPSLATAHPSPVAAAATPSPTAGAATSTSVCKRSVGSITISLASLEARSACGQTATMQQEEAKQYAADKATDKGRHLQAVALYRCKLASNKLPPTTSKLLKNQLQELWAVVGNGQPTVKPVRNMHIAGWLDALAMHMSPVTN